MRVIVSIFVFCGFTGCTTLPDVEQPTPDRAKNLEYADFVPMDRVILEQRIADARAEENEDELEARLNGLRARAARLRAASVE